MSPPTAVKATPTAYREASNRESRKIAAHRLNSAERVLKRKFHPAVRRQATALMMTGHLADDAALCRWLMEQAPGGR